MTPAECDQFNTKKREDRRLLKETDLQKTETKRIEKRDRMREKRRQDAVKISDKIIELYKRVIFPNMTDPNPPQFNENALQTHSLGDFTFKCEFCEALHFVRERIALKGKKFYYKICCRGEKFKLLGTRVPYPAWLERALTNRGDPHHDQLKEFIRRNNAAISFAFLKAKFNRPSPAASSF
jgi:hypothetical protein